MTATTSALPPVISRSGLKIMAAAMALTASTAINPSSHQILWKRRTRRRISSTSDA